MHEKSVEFPIKSNKKEVGKRLFNKINYWFVTLNKNVIFLLLSVKEELKMLTMQFQLVFLLPVFNSPHPSALNTNYVMRGMLGWYSIMSDGLLNLGKSWHLFLSSFFIIKNVLYFGFISINECYTMKPIVLLL